VVDNDLPDHALPSIYPAGLLSFLAISLVRNDLLSVSRDAAVVQRQQSINCLFKVRSVPFWPS
jgi:hypothetical protein